jgi:hypothetical protein
MSAFSVFIIQSGSLLFFLDFVSDLTVSFIFYILVLDATYCYQISAMADIGGGLSSISDNMVGFWLSAMVCHSHVYICFILFFLSLSDILLSFAGQFIDDS